MYKMLTNPGVDDVSNMLREGYTLHSVTPYIKSVSPNRYGGITDLIYHFVKDEKAEAQYDDSLAEYLKEKSNRLDPKYDN